MRNEAKEPNAQATNTIMGTLAPIVHDMARPAAQELGQFAGHTVRALLLPISKVLNLFEATVERVASEVEDILKGIPKEQLGEPAGYIAGPALEALRYTMDEDVLRSLYANLLATAIHTPSASRAHPSFVEIIKQLSPREARMLRTLAEEEVLPAIDLLADVDHSDITDSTSLTRLITNIAFLGPDDLEPAGEATQVALQNLIRLGLVEVSPANVIYGASFYSPIVDHPAVRRAVDRLRAGGYHTEYLLRSVESTALGQVFAKCCIIGPAATEAEETEGEEN